MRAPSAAILASLLLAAGMNCIDLNPDRAGDEPNEPASALDIVRDLKSDDWRRRSAAVLAARGRDDRRIRPELLRLLKDDPHPAVRDTAALALADLNETAAAPLIAARLRSGAASEPRFLMDALGRLGDAGQARALLPYLDSPAEELRRQAVESLIALKARDLGPEILRRARSSNNPDALLSYVRLLGELEVTESAGFLLERAATRPRSDLPALYLALGRIRADRAVPLLARALGSDFVPGRENAARGLVLIGSHHASRQSLPLLAHREREVGLRAAAVIVRIADPGAGPAVLNLLRKERERVTAPAALVLGGLRHAPARSELEAILAEPRNAERETVARALGMIGDERSVALLIRTARETSGPGRYGAVWGLGFMRAPAALTVLLEAAASSDLRMASLGIKALGSLRDPAALDAIYRLGRGDKALRLFAVDSIAAIPGAKSRGMLEEFAAGDDRPIARRARKALERRKEAGPESDAGSSPVPPNVEF